MTTTTKESKAKKSKLDRLPEDMQKFLCDGIAEAMKDWGGFLRMSQKFTTYSFNNTMLIWIQQLSRELEPSSQLQVTKPGRLNSNVRLRKVPSVSEYLHPEQ